MALFGKPAAVPWRRAPWWQSALEGVVLVATALLLVTPIGDAAGWGPRLVGWSLAAVLVFAYSLIFTRLRPANPPAGAVSPGLVATYLGAAALAFVATGVTGHVLGLRPGLAVAGVGAVIVLVVGQSFERAVDARVEREGLDRAPRGQSRDLLREARLKARGIDPGSNPLADETAVQRWARERRGSVQDRRDAEVAKPEGLELSMPGSESSPRRGAGPSDRRPSSKPRPAGKPGTRKKKRR